MCRIIDVNSGKSFSHLPRLADFPTFTKSGYNRTYMITNTNTNRNSKRNASTIVVNRHNLRDANGRFVSNLVNKTTATVVKSGRTNKSGSSFISSLNVVNDTVDVVMKRNPKIVYTYKPTKVGLTKVRQVIRNGDSLGAVYNECLKGREVKRTIYK